MPADASKLPAKSPSRFPKLVKGTLTLRGVLAPDLSPQIIPWNRLSQRRGVGKELQSIRLWPRDESGELMTLGGKTVAINYGESSKIKSLARRLMRRARWRAFTAGTLTLEGEVASARRALWTPIAIISVLGLAGLLALLLLKLQPPDKFFPMLAVSACLALWTGHLASLIAELKVKPIYPTWLRVEPGVICWRKKNGPIQRREVSNAILAETGRMKFMPTHDVADVVRDIAHTLSKRGSKPIALERLKAIVELLVQLASPLVLLSIYFALLFDFVMPGATATQSRSLLTLGLVPIVVISFTLAIHLATSRGCWRLARKQARRAKAHHKAGGRE